VKLNIRTANEKAFDKYWFDVTPSLYQKPRVDFLIYSCGSAKSLFVFPVRDFESLIEGASLGGAKQVPNFTIFLDRNEFEPAGRSKNRISIVRFRNNVGLVTLASSHTA